MEVTAGTAEAMQRGADAIMEAIDRNVTTPLVFGSKLVQGDNETFLEINLARPRINFHAKLLDIAKRKRARDLTAQQRAFQDQAIKVLFMGRLEMVRFINAEVDRRIPF